MAKLAFAPSYEIVSSSVRITVPFRDRLARPALRAADAACLPFAFFDQRAMPVSTFHDI
jgi:hypothetical protein